MKKKVLYLVVLIGLGFPAFAQTEKGDWLTGGSVSVNATDNVSNFSITPSAGYFFLNQFAAGGNISFMHSKTGSVKTTTFGIGPFARLYFMKNDFRPFLYGDFNFTTSKTSNNNSVSGNAYLLGVGGALFINHNVAIEGITGYSHSKIKNADGSGGFALRIGFQVYLSKRQVANIRNGQMPG